MSRRPKRTLVAEKVINLTEKDIWVYGTSGELVKLEPERLELDNGTLPPLEEGVFYVAEEGTLPFLEADPAYAERVLDYAPIGSGRNDEEIYRFEKDGMAVAPMSDHAGIVGKTF